MEVERYVQFPLWFLQVSTHLRNKSADSTPTFVLNLVFEVSKQPSITLLHLLDIISDCKRDTVVYQILH